MIGSSPVKSQRDLFLPLLSDFIDMRHELVLLGNAIDWDFFQKEFAPLYSDTGQPAMPIRFMVGCLMLKRIYNLGDETLPAAWVSNPYMQHFCGEAHFQHQFRCDPSDFVHFRKRIGQPGVEKIFAHSVSLHGRQALCKVVNSDTTVQENFTTFPTDAKLAKRVIDRCKRIADAEGVIQRQSYARVSKQLLRDSYNAKHPRRRKKATKARRRLRTLAGRVLRELERTLPGPALQRHTSWMELAGRAITQQRSDKDKVYSLHKSYTCCIAKGKAAKPYEFGNKVGLMTHPTKKIIVAIEAFEGNPHDSTTIAPLLNQMNRTLQHNPEEVVYDRGGKGKAHINGVIITTPDKPNPSQTQSQRRAKRRKFRRRSGIEAIIGHLKTDHRLGQNYLHGRQSPQINAMLSATGWNLKKWMQQASKKIKNAISRWTEWPRSFAYSTIN